MAAALSLSFAGGGGLWMPSRPSRRNSERDSVATSPLGFRTAAMRSRAAPRIPEGIGARDSPEAACGGIGAFLTRDDPVRRARGAGTRAPRRSRRPRRRRGCHAKGRGAPAPTAAPPASPRPPERPSPLALGEPLIVPARPSPAPRGGARAPAPLPGLRRRGPSRHCPQRIRLRHLVASRSPRPRRTTWRGTPISP